MRNTDKRNRCTATMSPELCGLIILLGGIGAMVSAVYAVMWVYEAIMIA